MTAKFLTADWRYLAMLNFEVDRSALTPYLPRGTELDDCNGRHYLSLVAFLFLDTHVLCRFALHVDGPLYEMDPGSEEEFLCERGWGYTRQPDGGTIEYRVEHARWRIWPSARHELAGPLDTFYDQPLPAILSGVPNSAFIADGSAVAVHMPERIA